MERLRTALVAMERWSAVPPPLNLPWTFAALCKALYRVCVQGCHGKPDELMPDESTRMKLEEEKTRAAFQVESLVLRLRRQQDKVDETAVPSIVKDIAFDVDVLGDKANLLVQEIKELKDMASDKPTTRRRSTRRSYTMSTVVSALNSGNGRRGSNRRSFSYMSRG